MKSISIPLSVVKGGLSRTEDPRKAIDSSLSLLMSTPCMSSVADPQYGFIFNNLRFEIFNESEGVVYNSSGFPYIFEGPDGLYSKKITGSSKNLNTFASELRDTISKYEKRLKDVNVTMTYIRQEQKIHVTVKGVIVTTNENYQYKTIINVWK